MPTVDFGYTHGLLSLEFSRAWFGVFGRSPGAFVAAAFALQMVIAWGLARIAARFALSDRALGLFCCLLPWAVIPNYLTLTHPLEAALIVHALAEHLAGRRPIALALLAACVFVKPSMAYVYGFVLVLMMLRDGWVGTLQPRAKRLATFAGQLIPAAIVGLVALAYVWWRYGAVPAKNTLFAAAGMSAYKETHFGLFTADGREFWAATNAPAVTGMWPFDVPLYYLLHPVTIWIVAVVVLVLVGAFCLLGFRLRRGRKAQLSEEVFAAVAIIHTVFLLAFYGWTHSWTYYSYMPFLALALVVERLNVRRNIASGLIVVAAFAHGMALWNAAIGWVGTTRTRESAGLFAWTNLSDAYRQVLDLTEGKPTLLLTNGYPSYLPGNLSLPDAWFPESGIATDVEVARVRRQALASDYVIVFFPYGKADLWNLPKFADVQRQFRRVPLKREDVATGEERYRNTHFELWARVKAGGNP